MSIDWYRVFDVVSIVLIAIALCLLVMTVVSCTGFVDRRHDYIIVQYVDEHNKNCWYIYNKEIDVTPSAVTWDAGKINEFTVSGNVFVERIDEVDLVKRLEYVHWRHDLDLRTCKSGNIIR